MSTFLSLSSKYTSKLYMYAPGYAPGLYVPGHALGLGTTMTAEPSRCARKLVQRQPRALDVPTGSSAPARGATPGGD
jgi:hypothetical protein